MWIALAFSSALFAGLTAILAKIGLQDTDSYLTTALRTIVVLIFAWIMVFVVGSQNTLTQISAFSFTFLVLSGLATGTSWLCYFKALQLGNVNKVTPVDKSSTVLTMLLAFIFLREPLLPHMLLAMLLIAAGTWLMITKKDVASSQPANRSWLIYALLSALFAALTAILAKVGIANVEPNLATAIRTAVVLIMAWLLVLKLGKQHGIKTIPRKSWLFIILSGLATGLSWLCYYRALQLGPASVVVPIDKLSIVVTVVFARIVFRERLAGKGLAGLMLIVAGTLALLI